MSQVQSSERFALVSGSADRLGRAFAVDLAKRGYQVAIHFFRNQKGAEETARLVEALGRKAPLIQADFTEKDAVKKVVEAYFREFPEIHLLVNNASAWSAREQLRASNDFFQETPEEWQKNFLVNCQTPFFLMQKFAPSLQKTGGMVISILDESARAPFPSRSSHSVSKSALRMASRVAAQALAETARIHCLELGPIVPPEELPGELSQKLEWAGVDSAVTALGTVLEGGHPSSYFMLQRKRVTRENL